MHISSIIFSLIEKQKQKCQYFCVNGRYEIKFYSFLVLSKISIVFKIIDYYYFYLKTSTSRLKILFVFTPSNVIYLYIYYLLTDFLLTVSDKIICFKDKGSYFRFWFEYPRPGSFLSFIVFKYLLRKHMPVSNTV